MKNIKIVEISQKLNISHSAVSQWFSGITKPTANKMFLLEDHFQIPLSAWRDIKSFINSTENDTKQSTPNSTTAKDEKVA